MLHRINTSPRRAVMVSVIVTLLLQWSIMCTKGEEVGEGTSISVARGWGAFDGCSIDKYTLKGAAGQEVDVITYGATITSVRVPDKSGNIADVVLGFDSLEEYISERNPYFGATVGRVANRIGNAEFWLENKKYRLAKNAGNNSLHGGYEGWNAKLWRASVENDCLTMSLLSPDGDEGYPGAVIATVTFSLSSSGELRIEMKAFVTRSSPINLTNHSYFNLAGHDGNATELYKHRFMVNADRWTVTDSESIPTGEIRSVAVSPGMDLREPRILGELIDQVPGGGYDYNFCLPNGSQEPLAVALVALVARVEHPRSGRYLEVRSNQPGVQFYTANSLPEIGREPPLRGKAGKHYYRHGAFCLETQNYPDAINHENFPNSVVSPGELYYHMVIYKFGVLA